MSAPDFRFTDRGCLRGCLSLVAVAGMFLFCQNAYYHIKPHFRDPSPIEVTVLDSGGRPVSGAKIVYEDHAIIPWMWFMPFGPARTIHEERTSETDLNGTAQCSIRFEGYLQQIRVGDAKVVVHHATTSGYYPTYTLKSIEGAGIAQWFRAPRQNIIQKTTAYLAPGDSKPRQ